MLPPITFHFVSPSSIARFQISSHDATHPPLPHTQIHVASSKDVAYMKLQCSLHRSLSSHRFKRPLSCTSREPVTTVLLYTAVMARAALSSHSSLILLCIIMSGWVSNVADAQKTWCVAKPSSDPVTLQNNINYACSHVDCRVMQKGCPCNSPDNLINHASIAMNLYYQCKGRNPWNCHFGNSGLVTITDPSYDGCSYE